MTKAVIFTIFALVAFAFNSILCRMALRGGEADAAGFTLIRIISGAVTLILISYIIGKDKSFKGRGNWLSAFFLFAYAVCFSFAYLGLSAGTGALILFGSVQLTMVLYSVFRGERPRVLEWAGLVTAVGGLVFLVLPGLSAPPLHSAALMAAAGVAWGAYTLRGRGSSSPLSDTTGNFTMAVPMAIVIALIFLPNLHLSKEGWTLAILSGAAASGVGYTMWYSALRHLTATRAAVVQLAVPVLAAALGVLLLAETATARLVIAAALTLGGILVVILGRKR
jgi:drug/metabolite transporter (DMT)-like permease